MSETRHRHEAAVLKAIVGTVPQWYTCENGENPLRLNFNDTTLRFYTHRPLSPALHSLLDYARDRIPVWEQQVPEIITPSSIAKISEDIAMQWLLLQDPTVKWNKWIAHADELRQRTHENTTIQKNLIISTGKGSVDVTAPELQNVLDSLTSSPQVYMRVNKDFRFQDYDEILWEEVRDSLGYKFSPEFLQPLLSTMKQEEYCAHLSPQGDILVAGVQGLLTSCRKGQWQVYDVMALRDAFVEISGNYHVGSHLFEILFDLSYSRRGALLVFDPRHLVIEHIVNKRARLDENSRTSEDLLRQMLAPRIRSIQMRETSHRLRKKRLFLEIAAVDGALIFDERQILAFGAMIEFHPNLADFSGARSAAAQSAFLWGGHSFKVSADGDITVLFRDKSSGGNAELQFR